jgi:hypothetical protein
MQCARSQLIWFQTDVIGSLQVTIGVELVFDLVGDPFCTIAHGVQSAVLTESRSDGTVKQRWRP